MKVYIKNLCRLLFSHINKTLSITLIMCLIFNDMRKVEKLIRHYFCKIQNIS